MCFTYSSHYLEISNINFQHLLLFTVINIQSDSVKSISSLSSQNLVSQKSEILQEREFSYRLSQFLVCDHEIQEIYKASNHLLYRLKKFS